MKCNNCGQNEAGFFQRMSINGHIVETHLCTECAERLEVMKSLPVQGILGDFFGGFGAAVSPFDRPAPLFAGLTDTVTEKAPAQPAVWPDAEVDEDMRKKREINVLREQMKDAAASEDFEKAMSLREEIRRLEM